MLALLTRTSSLPNVLMVLAIPASTCSSLANRYADSSLVFRVDFFCDCVGSFLIQVGDCNFRPFARKKDGYLLTNSARGTSDDSNFVF